MNIDDMKVGDFMHLLDSMQEECCEHKKCNGCRYNDFCDDIDLPSIDSVSLRKTIEGYAEANGLLDHMHYINDQKWIPVSERLPEYGELVLVETIYRDYELMNLTKMNGKDYFSNEEWLYRIDQIIDWMPLPE